MTPGEKAKVKTQSANRKTGEMVPRPRSFFNFAFCDLTFAFLLLSPPFLAGTPSAQSEPEFAHDHAADPSATGTPADTGWTAPGAAPTAADSLAAFRPDSLKDRIIRSAESAPSPFARKPAPRDSADSVAAILRGRRPAVSVHAGVLFLDLDAKDVLQASLDARMRRDSLTALQPYEPVHLVIPAGIQALLPMGPWFDLVARTQSSWYRQTAVLGRSGETAGEEYFAVQAHLAGAGLRYYLPPDLLSVTGKLGLFTQGVYYWLAGGGEIYTGHGSAPAEFEPAGSGWEIQVGFNRAVTRPWSVTGSLGFQSVAFASEKSWSDILVDDPPPGRVRWGGGALQASFNLWYHFGVESPSARSSEPALPAAGGPEAPAGSSPAPASPADSPRGEAAPSGTPPSAPVPAP